MMAMLAMTQIIKSLAAAETLSLLEPVNWTTQSHHTP
jgi:hypothetical protein